MRRVALALLVVVAAGLAGAVSGDLAARYEVGLLAVASPVAATPSPTPTAPPAGGTMDIPSLIQSIGPSVVAIDVVNAIGFGPRTILQKGAGTGSSSRGRVSSRRTPTS